jgi:hypothetical protein
MMRTLAAVAAAALTASPTPQAFRTAVHAAANAQRSVHYASVTNTAQGGLSIIGDAGRTQGIQRITFRKSARAGHVTVIVSARRAYIRGDAFTLTNFMGFKPRAAAKYANTWIVIAPGSGAYTAVAAAVTLASNVSEIGPHGTLSPVRTTTLSGLRVHAVRGTGTVQGKRIVDVLYARATGAPLPVAEITTQGANLSRTTFGPWNAPVHVSVPAHAVPIAKVLGSGGPTA